MSDWALGGPQETGLGYHSDLAIRLGEEGPGYAKIMGRYVCAACFEDDALKALIEDEADQNRCDYCGRESDAPIAAALDDLVSVMRLSIEREWTNADHALPRDPETGELMLEPTVDTETLLTHHIGLDLPNDDGSLFQDIAAALPDCVWCRDDPLVSSRDEAIANSWRSFCQIICHQRRFFFMQHETPDLDRDIEQAHAAYTVPELLEALIDYAEQAGLFTRVPPGTTYVRCQSKPDSAAPAFAPERMASPPIALAVQTNRMSPPGISMFYGAETAETALAEIASETGRFARGDFRLLREAVLLDLRTAPPVPSLFDQGRAEERPFALFMREFVSDFRKPIADTDRKHVDYVPTQVVTEYIRSVARSGGLPIDGILYSSTKAEGKTAVVLFADNAAVVRAVALEPWELDSDVEPWLEMIGYGEGVYDYGTGTFA